MRYPGGDLVNASAAVGGAVVVTINYRLNVFGFLGSSRLAGRLDGVPAAWRASVMRIVGGAGTGKTCNTIALGAHALKHRSTAPNGDERLVVWLHAPWAGNVLTGDAKPPELDEFDDTGEDGASAAADERSGPPSPRGAFEEMIIRSTTQKMSDIRYLRARPLVVIIDSIDELQVGTTPVREVLSGRRVLEHGGILTDEWPNAVFVLATRDEFDTNHRLTKAHFHPYLIFRSVGFTKIQCAYDAAFSKSDAVQDCSHNLFFPFTREMFKKSNKAPEKQCQWSLIPEHATQKYVHVNDGISKAAPKCDCHSPTKTSRAE
eukprot:gene3143-9551_t